MIPPFETTFAVPLSCESCIKDVSTSLHNLEGIHTITPSLPHNLISILGTAPPSALAAAIQATGRPAILRGSGASNSNANSAAVCILETHARAPTAAGAGSAVRGLARLVQVAPRRTVLDVGLRGVAAGTYGVTVRERGDISAGAGSTGGVWGETKGEEEEEKAKGWMGTVEVGPGGRGAAFLDRPVEVWELIGRGMVVRPLRRRGAAQFDAEDPDTLVGVVARSAGAWDNDKTVCSCSGKTVWEEREEQTERGML